MKKLLFTFVTLLSLNTAHSQCKEIIGYFPSWQWYDRNKLVNPMTIAYSKYTIINYSFFNPQADGTLLSYDAWADENLLKGEINWQLPQPAYYPNTSIIDRAHNANVKVMASVGGWTLSGNFPTIAASQNTRTAFAHACVDLCREYNFDGIDVDWEYPGFAEHGGTVNDKANYTLLMQELRDSLTAYGTQTNHYKLLTACFGASRSNMENIEWDAVEDIVDYINMMTYDFFGSWNTEANHNSPLMAPAMGDSTMNLNSCINYLINHYNVPSNKITGGVAFYGRSAKTTTAPALFASIVPNVVDSITFDDDLGMPLYYNILEKMNLFTDNWDAIAKVPYLTGNGSLQTFVSYDNEKSIADKAQYAVDMNLGGAIIWEITGDYLETAPGSGVILGTPLVDTLKSVMCANIPSNPTSVKSSAASNDELLAYPNPAASEINFMLGKGDITSVQIISMTGAVVEQVKNTNSRKSITLDVSKYAPGIYAVDVTNSKGTHFRKTITVIK